MAHRGAQACPHLQRIPNDLVVVKGQGQTGPMFDEFRRCRIVSGFWRGLMHENKIRGADTVMTRVTLWIGIDPDKFGLARLNPSLFLQFPQRCSFHRFAEFDEPAGQRVLALKRRVLAANQQQPFMRIENDAVGRDPRLFTTLQNYLHASNTMDRSGVFLFGGLPSGWMLVGIGGLVPAFVSGAAPSAAAMAISLGGVMIAQRAFTGISGGLSGLARASIAWKQVAELFRCGSAMPSTEPYLSRDQMRGTGSQLSHGERSRIFLARALLQGAQLTVMDESFAALDPETLEKCLRATFKRAQALIVIAHP